MQDIHFINKRIGGVGVICDRLSVKGDRVIDLGLKNIANEIIGYPSAKLYFHQPRSHLYCLIFLLLYPKARNRFSCVLHEASNYNVGAANYSRALIGFMIRRAVIFLLELLNVEIMGVSDYVLRTYGIFNGRKISYINLFKDDVRRLTDFKRNNTSSLCESTLIIWIRRGDSHRVFQIIQPMKSKNLFNKVSLFGDDIEVALLKQKIGDKLKWVTINSHPTRISRMDFIGELEKSTWFLSVFDKEGFGLSIFEAMAAGCVCLTSKSGAASEWLPSENYLLLDCIMQNKDFDHGWINQISNLNKEKAKVLMS